MSPDEINKEHQATDIRVRLIENGLIVKAGASWFAFKTWEGPGGAAEHIAARLRALALKREGIQR